MKYSFLALSIGLLLASCKKDPPINNSCFDQQLKDSTVACPEDCVEPVIGCDGKTYCNTCLAAMAGVKVIGKATK